MARATGPILIVDDEPKIRKVLRQMLEDLGYRCLEARNARQMLERVGDSMPQAVLLDIQMPGLDGRQALRLLKQRSPATPVIMITAYPEYGPAQEWAGLGASDYLVKPFTLERLKESLEKTIGDRRGNGEQRKTT